ncbi:zinc finger protein 184-like isoform X1 [Bacillus rossius redtenbacheri]|uniref:zinc finger protein 184-like isoform X1 n=1 Tax=Bacillus rossius redtenbacheri TaxID=93214 RepID=UPI002FDEC837
MKKAANEDLMVKQEPSEIVFPLIKEESVNEQPADGDVCVKQEPSELGFPPIKEELDGPCEDSWQPEPGSSSASQDYTLCKQQVKEEITIEEHPIAAATADVWNDPHSCVGYHGNTSSGCIGHRSQDSPDTCILIKPECEDSWQPEPGSSSASQDYTLCKQQVKEITIEEHPIAAATAAVWNEPHSCVGYHGNTSSGCMGHRSQDSPDTCILIKPEVTNTEPMKLSSYSNCHPESRENYCVSNCIPTQQRTITHTGQKRFFCQLCSAKFSKSSNLKQHSLTHTGEKPFSCTECSAKFSKSSNLKEHSLTHTGDKPFSCTVCIAKFRKSSHLKHHSLTHTGEKPFTCTVCSAKFRRTSTLKQHSITHTEEKPFTCTVCSAKFRRASTLKQHSLTHTGEKSLC